MNDSKIRIKDYRVLHLPLAVYTAASLLHFVHNAEMLHAYPNMPPWITRGSVYSAWMVVTGVGVAGYFLLRLWHYFAGFIVIALYAMLGFSGLGHYALAPISSHTAAMNATIWLEFATAAVLLIVIVRRIQHLTTE